jgi:hypothetical protein
MLCAAHTSVFNDLYKYLLQTHKSKLIEKLWNGISRSFVVPRLEKEGEKEVFKV